MNENGDLREAAAPAARPLRDKSFAFAVRTVMLARHLRARHKEFDLARQLIKSGTAIGALVREAENAESKADFVHKIHIAFKEAGETAYWLELLHATDYLTASEFRSLDADLNELLKMLTATLKTAKSRLDKN